jgi:uncharacterized protein (DUF2336 family)
MSAPVHPLVELSQSRAAGDRERLLARLADLFEVRARPLPHGPAAEAEAVFLALTGEADSGVRARLAERIARAVWPPVSLIDQLARDEIEVARPLLAASPRLSSEALLKLVQETGPDHRVEIAHRPLIAPAVVAALVASDEPPVIQALAANATARIDEPEMARLVALATGAPTLASTLAAHPRLSLKLARDLYASADAGGRARLAERFNLGAEVTRNAGPSPVADLTPASAPEEAEIKLVDKLAAAGQLRAGYLVRVLREQRLGLFVASLAKLGGFAADEVRRAVDDVERPELLALACAAIELDRSVFPTVLDLVRQINGGLPGGGAEGARRASSSFGPFTPPLAATAFRLALGAQWPEA